MLSSSLKIKFQCRGKCFLRRKVDCKTVDEYACKFKSTATAKATCAFINFLSSALPRRTLPTLLETLERYVLHRGSNPLKIRKFVRLKTICTRDTGIDDSRKKKIRNRRWCMRKRTGQKRPDEGRTSGAFWNGTRFVTLACAPRTCVVVNAVVQEGPRRQQKEEEDEDRGRRGGTSTSSSARRERPWRPEERYHFRGA